MFAKKSQGKSLVILMSVLATLSTLALVGVLWFNSDGKLIQIANAGTSTQGTRTLADGEPMFLPLDKFVISIEGRKVVHYMMLEVSLVTRHQESMEELIEVKPLVRNALVKKMSKYSHTQVRAQLKDLDSLQQELLEDLRDTLSDYGVVSAIDEVLITKMVIQ